MKTNENVEKPDNVGNLEMLYAAMADDMKSENKNDENSPKSLVFCWMVLRVQLKRYK